MVSINQTAVFLWSIATSQSKTSFCPSFLARSSILSNCLAFKDEGWWPPSSCGEESSDSDIRISAGKCLFKDCIHDESFGGSLGPLDPFASTVAEVKLDPSMAVIGVTDAAPFVDRYLSEESESESGRSGSRRRVRLEPTWCRVFCREMVADELDGNSCCARLRNHRGAVRIARETCVH